MNNVLFIGRNSDFLCGLDASLVRQLRWQAWRDSETIVTEKGTFTIAERTHRELNRCQRQVASEERITISSSKMMRKKPSISKVSSKWRQDSIGKQARALLYNKSRIFQLICQEKCSYACQWEPPEENHQTPILKMIPNGPQAPITGPKLIHLFSWLLGSTFAGI